MFQDSPEKIILSTQSLFQLQEELDFPALFELRCSPAVKKLRNACR